MKRYLLIPVMGLMLGGLFAIDLNSSIEQAFRTNKTLLMAAEEIQKADYQYKEVRGNLLPS